MIICLFKVLLSLNRVGLKPIKRKPVIKVVPWLYSTMMNTNTNTISDLYSAAIQIVQRRWQSYEKASVNKWDFELRLNTDVLDTGIAWKCGETVPCCWTGVTETAFANFVLVVRLIYLAVSVNLKRRRLPEKADCTLSTRYCGARPVWIWCISKQSLYLILLETGIQ